MKRRVALGTLFLMMSLCLGSSAGATAAEDVERGSGVQIVQFGVTVNGSSYEAGSVFLPKGPDTLDTALDASALGLAVSLRVPLRGTRSGDTITWNFDVRPSPAVDIGWPNSVVRFRGSLVLRATTLPGDADPRCGPWACPYNVRLTALPSSAAVVTISSFAGIQSDHRVENVRFIAYGGLPRARLQQFVVNRPPRRLCSRTSETYLSGRVVTEFRAPSGGAWVSITSSDPARVRVLGVRVPAGEQSAPVGIYLAPNWAGGVMLTASAGGATQTVALNVEPPSACNPLLNFSIPAYLNACPTCFRPYWLNSSGDIFGDLNGKPVFLRRDWQEPVPLGAAFLLGAGQFNALRLNGQGQLLGSLSAQGPSVGFFADVGVRAQPMAAMKTFKDTELAGANDLGVVVGTRSLGSRPTAFYFNGEEQVDLPVKTWWGWKVPFKAEWSRAVAVNNRGEILGNTGDGKRSRPFVFYRKAVEFITDFGEGSGTATALSEAGHVVGFVQGKGETRGFIAERTPDGAWRSKDLGRLPGFDDLRPVAVNSYGVVVGTARPRPGVEGPSTAFIYTPGGGLADLNKLVNSQARAVAAMTITDANEILVLGDLGGKQVSFVLRPDAQRGGRP